MFINLGSRVLKASEINIIYSIALFKINSLFLFRMNLPLFISRKVATGSGKRFSGIIIRIAIAAVALSVAVMIVAMAMIAGFKNEIRSKIFGFWGHIHIMHASVGSTLEVYPIDKRQPFYPHIDTVGSITYLDYPRIGESIIGNELVEKTSKDGVRHIQAFTIKPGIIKTKNEMEGIVVKGVGKDFDWSYLEKYLVEGRKLSWNDSLSSEEIIISQITANRLKLSLGDKFIMYFVEKGEQLRRRFEIVGIYKTGLEEYDQKFALTDIRRIRDVLGWEENQVSGFEVFLDEIDDLAIFKAYLYEMELPMELYAETMREKDPNIFDWLDLQDTNEVVILVLMIIVAIINTVTALMILILERTNMIGILKALGAKNWLIQKIFLGYATYIVLMGLFWGNFVGLGLCFVQDTFKIIRLSEADYFLSYAPIHWNFSGIFSLNIGMLVITFICLIIPSFLVSGISPVKAITFK